MIRQDPLFKGCTRPAMVFGIPIVPLGIVVGVVILLAVWITLLITVALIPIIFVMRMITKSDDQQFRLLGLKMYCRLIPNTNKNAQFWKASAYSPISFKKRT
jgi:type IV secretion system protein VirB3